MSSGGNLPYQLRPNKAVERLIFLDLLKRLDPLLKIGRRYGYFGFGGPQMEDFRLLHEHFQQMKMTSIEKEPEVLKRQEFNAPHTNIIYKLQAASDFTTESAILPRSIIWLDYTVPAERIGQVEDFQNLLRRVRNLSVVKITMNAASSTLGGIPGRGLNTQRLDKFREFERFFPNGQFERDIYQINLPTTLLRVLEFAAAEVLRDRPTWRSYLLTSAVYADGLQMVTATYLIGDRATISSVIRRSKIAEWSFYKPSLSDSVKIDVPELTLKERIHINQLLPRCGSDVDLVHQALNCCVDSNPMESQRKLLNYMTFHRHYPHFGKVAI